MVPQVGEYSILPGNPTTHAPSTAGAAAHRCYLPGMRAGEGSNQSRAPPELKVDSASTPAKEPAGCGLRGRHPKEVKKAAAPSSAAHGSAGHSRDKVRLLLAAPKARSAPFDSTHTEKAKHRPAAWRCAW